ncbi:hypothetical protein NM208_g4737 [Fusarium decemcellulare]|uniref:Uncharacterized protein n=1 Tax=Fusarium decemcellulare TaxID=57161 RepID=A0ACC1SJL1_9HYPO|nr:hypothetical protein NM208_g4737 [Fusarium decemcellulare]
MKYALLCNQTDPARLCDGATPICQRCIKSRRTCVEADAAKQQLFAIHIENQYATGEKRRPRGPRSSLVPLDPNFDLKTRAHAYYVQSHFQVFQDIPDVAATWAECFQEWKLEGNSSPIVDLAFSSLALSVFSRFQDCWIAASEASKSYLCLLQHMQSCIPQINSGNPSAGEIDAYLLGAHFMARYESFGKNYGDTADSEPQVKVWFHIDGAAAILKIWHDNSHRYTPTAVIKHTRRKLIRSSLLREQPLPRWLADGNLFGETGIALAFDRLMIQFIDIRHKYLKLKQETQDGISVTEQVDYLIKDSRTLSQNIQAWPRQFPSKWLYESHTVPEACSYSRDEFYSASVSTCAKLGYSAVWNEFYATQMLVSHTHLRILDLVATNRSETHEFLAQLNSSAKCLASFIPFCLGRIRTTRAGVESSDAPFKPHLASLVVWPMTLASSLDTLEIGLREWYRSALARVSKGSSECLLPYAMSDYWAIC